MEKSAQEGIIQSAEQPQADLHNNVAGNVEQITGHPTNPESLNPEDQSPLKKLEEVGAEIVDVTHGLGTTVGEKLGGEVSYFRGNESKNWRQKLLARFHRKPKLTEKAA